MVFRHLAQIFIFLLSRRLVCRLIYCRLMVFILEWERLASLVEPRPQSSHVLDIILNDRQQLTDNSSYSAILSLSVKIIINY